MMRISVENDDAAMGRRAANLTASLFRLHSDAATVTDEAALTKHTEDGEEV